MAPTIRDRINQLLQLCGEDPSAALAARIDVLPLLRDHGGWVAVREDGTFVFVDDDTGRVIAKVPPEWVRRAVEAAGERYPELGALLQQRR